MYKLIAAIALILTTLVLNTASADSIENLKRQAYMYCTSYGQDAEAIQMIRQDGDTLDELILKLSDMLTEEKIAEGNNQIVFLMEVKRVGQWVYAKYPNDWEPKMVGSTYTQECLEHTMASIGEKPKGDIAGAWQTK